MTRLRSEGVVRRGVGVNTAHYFGTRLVKGSGDVNGIHTGAADGRLAVVSATTFRAQDVNTRLLVEVGGALVAPSVQFSTVLAREYRRRIDAVLRILDGTGAGDSTLDTFKSSVGSCQDADGIVVKRKNLHG